MSLERFQSKNLYELLGVKPTASSEEIERAYREIAKVYDPASDFFSDIIEDPPRPKHNQIFALVTNAHKILSDPEQRKNYDGQLASEALRETLRFLRPALLLCLLALLLALIKQLLL